MKEMGMKAVVKKKRPLLTKCHRGERMDFALSHEDRTIGDWKKVFWSDETKINYLGSDGRKWVWKRDGESLSDRLVEVLWFNLRKLRSVNSNLRSNLNGLGQRTKDSDHMS